MEINLKRLLSHLRKSEQLHLDAGKKMMDAAGGKIFPVDLLANAVLHRSTNLVRGFANLVEQRNLICAAPLLRLQIDNCLRFYAVFLVKKPHDFATEIFKGVPVHKMKDRNGERMTDAYLVKQLNQLYPWVSKVYKRTSGYVHLSDTHIFNTFAPRSLEHQNDRIQTIVIGVGDCFDGDELYEEATAAFIEATQIMFNHIIGWVKTKENPQAAKQSK